MKVINQLVIVISACNNSAFLLALNIIVRKKGITVQILQIGFLEIVLVCCNKLLERFCLAIIRNHGRTSALLSRLTFAVKELNITHTAHIFLI